MIDQKFKSIINEISSIVQPPKPEGGRLLVGCSGGVDSMLLGAVIAEFCRTSPNWQFKVAHVNYGLRGDESAGDEAFVREFWNARGVTVVVKNPPAPAKASGIQEWARRVRFDWFRELQSEWDFLCLGHHRDDLSENVLLRTCRGAPWFDLGGMAMASERILRPFLRLPKSELLALATRHNIPSRHDSSNDKLFYSRNRLRHRVLPELTSLYSEAPGKLADLGQDLKDVGEWVLAQLLNSPAHHGWYLEVPWLAGLPMAIREMAIRSMEAEDGFPGRAIPGNVISRVLTKLASVLEVGVAPAKGIKLGDAGNGYCLSAAGNCVALVRATADLSKWCQKAGNIDMSIWDGDMVPGGQITQFAGGYRPFVVRNDTLRVLNVVISPVVDLDSGTLIPKEKLSGKDFLRLNDCIPETSQSHLDERFQGGPEFAPNKSQDLLVFVDNELQALWRKGKLLNRGSGAFEIKLVDCLISIQDHGPCPKKPVFMS